MGVPESKPVLERKPTKTKSNLGQKSVPTENVSSFASQLNTLACISTTNQSTYEYAVFQKLPFSGHFSQSPLCSKISGSGESVFVCYDCSTDDHAYICEKCFEKGKHDSHRFSVFPNNDGWRQLYCRCGDLQFMKKKTVCQIHAKITQPKNEAIDKAELARFSAYFNQTFKVLFSLMDKDKSQYLENAVFGYLEKASKTSLYYSKIICEFFLQTNIVDGKSSNLRKFIQQKGMQVFRWYNVFRNLNFVTQYKIQFLREMINGFNIARSGTFEFYELIFNFAGKIDGLNALAKDQNLIVGINLKQDEEQNCFRDFYSTLIRTKTNATQIWRCLVRNKKIKNFISNSNIISQIIKSLLNDQEYVVMLLQQFLAQNQSEYVTICLMILSPQFFIPAFGAKKGKGKNYLDKLEKQFLQFYGKMFSELSTHQQYQQITPQLLLILPYFSFGQQLVNQFWDEFQKRVQIISKNKEKRVIKEVSLNFFELISNLLRQFMTWDHQVLTRASTMNLLSYTKDSKLIEKVLTEFFDKNPKIVRQNMLSSLDVYTQKQRNLAKDIIKKNLRYNKKKGKYYNISKKLPNNSFNFDEINVGYPIKFTQWQQFIGKKFFTDAFYRLIPNLIQFAQKALQQDIQMVKIVANIAVCVILLNDKQKKNIKEVTRNFIKQIPDVNENIYYILAKIRDRLQLDIDDLEQSGKKGSKKPKLDLINEIRDKKFKQMRAKQEKMRQKWLKQAQKQDINADEDYDQNICVICKQKDGPKRRFVYPCSFSRNNVVSTMLKSLVTDLDINICLHKAHQDCFEKIKNKGECPICKFRINCYVPEKPLADEPYTKNWLRNFENIVTTINMESGKSFNSDWATIFLTYLVFSCSFKVLLKNTQLQDKQREITDNLVIMHYKNQLQKWPELTKQAIKRAQKTVKGQVRRQSNIKKGVKSLVLDLVLQQITGEPFKNVKRVQKKFRQMINMIGSDYAQKINECFAWSRENEGIKQVFTSNQADAPQQLFKIRQLPQKASQYLLKTSIKCPMCSKYQPTTWQCLFCTKISCSNCINPKFHCDQDHRGSGIILYLNDAKYQLYHDGRQVESDSLYRNQYSEGWQRNQNPQGWQAHTDEIYNFYDTILHSQNPFKAQNTYDPDSDDENPNANRAWNNNNNNFGGMRNNNFGGFGNTNNFGGFGNTTNVGFGNVGFGNTNTNSIFGAFGAPQPANQEPQQEPVQQDQQPEEEDDDEEE